MKAEITVDAPSAVSDFRKRINKETCINLDFGYLSGAIESWWMRNNHQPTHTLKLQLLGFFQTYLRSEDTMYFDKVGLADEGVAAVCIKNIFRLDSPKLALTAHEALAELFYLTDIKYEYEEHKALYLKPSAEQYKEWGNGYGDITPHSDDLYENMNIDYLALTVCRDTTHTPTTYYFPRDLIDNLSDDELGTLLTMQAIFTSGKNVNGFKERIRNIVTYDPLYGYQFSLDFRIDQHCGERMRAINGGQHILDKMRAGLAHARHHVSTAQTGTFLILANHKILHARPMLNISVDTVRKHSATPTIGTTPRLLFRSKGPRKYYYPLDENPGVIEDKP